MKKINEMTFEELEIMNRGLSILYETIHDRACKMVASKKDCTGEIESLRVILELTEEIVSRYRELVNSNI